jgi:sugar lactone lactonase YvrE
VVTTATVESLGVSPSGTLTDVAVANDGTILAVDASENCLQSFPSGTGTTWAGVCSSSGWDTNGTRLGGAQFYGPIAIALSGSTLYVAEDQGQVIRAIDASGNVTSFSGSGSQGTNDGAASLAQFNSPDGICPDGAGGLYVADTDNHRIRHVDASGAVQTIAGSTAGFNNDNGLAAQFDYPQSIAMDSAGNLFVADSANCAIREIAPNLDVSTFAINATNCSQGHRMYGVAVDAADNVYASNLDDSTIYRWNPAGTLTAQIAGNGLQQPRNIKVDAQGRVLVANTGSSEVLRLTIP